MSDGLIGLELLDRKDSAGLDFARGMLRRDSYADKRGTLVLRGDGRFNFVG